MTDIDYSSIKKWGDAVSLAKGDLRKAHEIWAEVKGQPSKGNIREGGSSENDREEEWINEQIELDELLQRADVNKTNRRKYIIDMFYNTEDIERLKDPTYMDSILRIAKVSADKRRMILMAWYHLDERAVEHILQRKKPYDRHNSHKDDEEGFQSPSEIVEDQLTRELELKQKKLERLRAMKEMEELEEELKKYNREKEEEKPKKVKVPLKDRHGNIVKDAEGKIVFVLIDPQEEYENQKYLESNQPSTPAQNPNPDTNTSLIMEMMKQQQDMMMQFMQTMVQNNNNSDADKQMEFYEKVLEQMKEDKEQTTMTIQKLQQEIEKKKREDMEERMAQLQNAIANLYQNNEGKVMQSLDEVKKLRQEYPELFGGRSPAEIAKEMEMLGVKQSYDLAKGNQELLSSVVKDIEDLYKQKLLNDIRLQSMKEEAELTKAGVPIRSPITPQRLKDIEKKIEES